MIYETLMEQSKTKCEGKTERNNSKFCHQSSHQIKVGGFYG